MRTQFCFTYRGQPIRWDLTNTAWVNAVKKAELEDFRFHDLRHTWASWYRQAGTSCDELKDLGGWNKVIPLSRFCHDKGDEQSYKSANSLS